MFSLQQIRFHKVQKGLLGTTEICCACNTQKQQLGGKQAPQSFDEPTGHIWPLWYQAYLAFVGMGLAYNMKSSVRDDLRLSFFL